MMDAIGFLELSSIAKGFEAADAILKAANVELVFARAVCPGKYAVLFTGDVAAVKASLEAGIACGGPLVVDSTLIPRVHRQVIIAIAAAQPIDQIQALGIMEFYSITAAVYGADAAVKAADVDLLEVRLGTGIGGKSYVVLTGDVAAANAAVNAGIAAENTQGMLVSSVVIPNPHHQLHNQLY